MRIHENNFAYELEQVVDPATQVKTTTWRYNIYRIRPVDQKLISGEAATMEAAERKAKKAVAKFTAAEPREEKSAA